MNFNTLNESFDRLSEKLLNEGHGAGYEITFKTNPYKNQISNIKIENLSWAENKRDVEVWFNCDFQTEADIRVESYYYGHEEEDVKVKAHQGFMFIDNDYLVNTEGIEITLGDDIPEMDKEKLAEIVKDEVNAHTFVDGGYVYGGGWGHSVYDGSLSDADRPAEDNAYGDIYFSDLRIVDERIINIFEYYASGEFEEDEDEYFDESLNEEKSYSDFQNDYKYALKNFPDMSCLWNNSKYEITCTETNYTKYGSKWEQNGEPETRKISYEEYFNYVESIPFFHDRVGKAYTYAGKVPTSLTSKSPDGKHKVMYQFGIDYIANRNVQESLQESEIGATAYASYNGPDVYGDGYAIFGYYDEDCRALADSNWCSNWEEVQDLVHGYISKGDVVRIINNETGNDIIVTPDEYFDNFEGDFPIAPQDVEEGHMWNRTAKLDSFDLDLDESLNKAKVIEILQKALGITKQAAAEYIKNHSEEIVQSVVDKFLQNGKKPVTEAFEKEGGPFWYYSKHGMGPGTIPKGVQVVDIYEDDDFNTWVALDKVLTTQELDNYELREQTPPDLEEGVLGTALKVAGAVGSVGSAIADAVGSLKEDSEIKPRKKFMGKKSVIKR